MSYSFSSHYLMSWRHYSAKINYHSLISPLSLRTVFADLVFWRHHSWSVCERVVLELWRHIRGLANIISIFIIIKTAHKIWIINSCHLKCTWRNASTTSHHVPKPFYITHGVYHNNLQGFEETITYLWRMHSMCSNVKSSILNHSIFKGRISNGVPSLCRRNSEVH